MKQKLTNDVIQGMLSFLNNAQAAQLQKVLECELAKVEITECEQNSTEVKNDNERLTELFLSAKRVEGCSEKSLKFYRSTISAMLEKVGKRVQEIETDDLREYLTDYQKNENLARIRSRRFPPSRKPIQTRHWNRCGTTAIICAIWH